MKLIKLLSFLLILTSCDQYFGVIEPDYIPTNETKEVFEKNIIIQKKMNLLNIQSLNLLLWLKFYFYDVSYVD